MYMGHSKDQRSDPPAGDKRAYNPPRIVFRERLESITAICDPTFFGKSDPFACPSASPPMS